jgi:hypothetical protein
MYIEVHTYTIPELEFKNSLHTLTACSHTTIIQQTDGLLVNSREMSCPRGEDG